METGNTFTVNYTAINSQCNCTITPRFNGSLNFFTHTTTENCSTEIAIHRLQQSEFNTLITIPCKDAGRTLFFNVTQDSVFYITSRSVNTKIDPEIFSQFIAFGGIPLFINFKILYIYCMMIMKIWRFISPEKKKSYFTRATPEGNLIFLGE